MIKFKNLEIKGFKGLVNETKDSLEGVIELKNGEGKTTRLDAICYLLTNKLLNGSTTGIDYLDKDNEVDVSIKPSIGLDLIVNETIYKIKLLKGFRHINDIKFQSLKDFQESLNQILGPIKNLHLLINPEWLLEYCDTKTARDLFLSSYSFEEIQMKIIDLQEYEFSPEFWNKIKITSDTKLLLSNLRTRKQTLLNQIEVQDSSKMVLETTTDKEANAQLQLSNIKQEIENVRKVEKQINEELRINCISCGQILPNKIAFDKLHIEELKGELKSIDKKLGDLRLKEQEYKVLDDSYRVKLGMNKRIKELEETLITKIEEWKSEIQVLTNEENEILIYQDLKVKALKLFLDNDLPFTVKLFHKSKTTGSYTEVFTLLYEGVDYKYVNRARKLLMGIGICKFFQKQSNINIQILIDNLETMDNNSLSLIDIPFIGTRVIK